MLFLCYLNHKIILLNLGFIQTNLIIAQIFLLSKKKIMFFRWRGVSWRKQTFYCCLLKSYFWLCLYAFWQFFRIHFKVGWVYTLPFRCISNFLDLTKLRNELSFLKDIILKNGNATSFTDHSFKILLDHLFLYRP